MITYQFVFLEIWFPKLLRIYQETSNYHRSCTTLVNFGPDLYRQVLITNRNDVRVDPP